MKLEWIDNSPDSPGVLAMATPSPKTTYRVMPQTETTFMLVRIELIGKGPVTNNHNAGQDFPTIEDAKAAAQSDWDIGDKS